MCRCRVYAFSSLWHTRKHEKGRLLAYMGIIQVWKNYLAKQNPTTIGPFSNSPQSADWGLTQGSRGGCWNQVSAPLGCLDVVWRFRAPLCSFTLHYIRVDLEYLAQFYRSNLEDEVLQLRSTLKLSLSKHLSLLFSSCINIKTRFTSIQLSMRIAQNNFINHTNC